MKPVYGILLGCFCCVMGCSGSQAPAQMPDSTLVLISLDGFRWDYIDRFETPNLDQLVADGVKAKSLIPVFPTKTFPSHFSLVTGLYPDKHGVVSNTMYDPVYDAQFSIRDQGAVGDERWWGGEPIWVTAEKQGKIAATYFWPGSEAPIQGIRPSHWKVYDGQISNKERIATVLDWLDLPVAEQPRFITIYFNDVDYSGHRFGPDSPEVEAAVRKLDAELGVLVDGIQQKDLLDKVNLMVVSDHGMTSISSDHVVFVDDYINLDEVTIVNWSPVLDLWPLPGKEDKIYEALVHAHPKLQVYRKNEIPERLKYRDHRRIPPLTGIVAEGWTCTSHARFENSSMISGGNHGYDNQIQSMHSLFIAAGPAFKKGFVVDSFENIHLYNLMSAVLGIKPAPNDGDFEVVRSLLVPEYSSDRFQVVD